ncbi:MAG: response regulator [Saprospiraceae bacterium]
MNNKLLIVDDETDACLLMTHLLRHKFAQIECAHTLTEGLERAANTQPEVILLDNNLPDGYGIEHIGDFKNFGAHPARVVVISALDLRSEALAAGADHFVSKPIALSDLPW